MGIFSSPETKFEFPMEQMASAELYQPLVHSTGAALFGTPDVPAQYSDPGLLGRLFGVQPRLLSEAKPGTPGLLSTKMPDWQPTGASPLQQQGFNLASQLPGQSAAYQQMGMNLLRPMDFGPTKDYVGRLWNEDIMPGIMENFAGAGTADSGGAMKALSRAGERMSLGLASTLAPMELQSRGQQLSALPQLAGMPMDAARFLDIIGGTQRGIASEQGMYPYNHPALQFLFPTMAQAQTIPVQSGGGIGQGILGSALGLGASALTGGILGGLSPDMTFGEGMKYTLGGFG